MAHNHDIHSDPYTLMDPDNDIAANIRAEYGSNAFGVQGQQSTSSSGGGGVSWWNLDKVIICVCIALFFTLPGLIATIIAIIIAFL